MIPAFTEVETARFHSKVEHGEGCWLWRGSDISNQGYGMFAIYRNGGRRRFLAHRVAFFLSSGEDPGSDVVRHDCDTPLCCHPAHLRRGSQKDNIDDAVRRGRIDISGLVRYTETRDDAARRRVDAQEKRCSRCKIVKPFQAFYRATANFDGCSYWCKDCLAEQQRARRRERQGLSERERRKLKRAAV